MQSLRSLNISRLNITSLPDGWLGQEVDAIGIRSLNVSQTKLTFLPRDLIRENINLEQITFQGIYLLAINDHSHVFYFRVKGSFQSSMYDDALKVDAITCF